MADGILGLDFLKSSGYGLLNQLPDMINGIPMLLQQQLMAELGPVAGSLAAPLANKAIGKLYDAFTGTSDSDLSYSERIGQTYVAAMRTRDRNMFSRTLRKTYGAGKNAEAVAAAAARIDTENLLKDIYGTEYKPELTDSWAARALTGIGSIAREQAYKSGIGGLSDALAAGAVVYGFGPGGDGWTNKQRSAFTQNLGNMIQRATLGYNGEGSITGTLSNDEIRAAVTEFAKLGGFSGKDQDKNLSDMRDYLSKIAAGVDNIKQVMGDGVSAEYAKQLITGMTGTSASVNNASAFSALTQRFKDLSYATGINDKDWANGTAAAMQQLSPFGVPQSVAAGLGLNIAAQYAIAQNKNLGVSDKEFRGIIAARQTEAVKSGAVYNVAAAEALLEQYGVSDDAISAISKSISANPENVEAMVEAIAKETGRDVDKVRESFYLIRKQESTLKRTSDGRIAANISRREAKKDLETWNSQIEKRAVELLGAEGAEKLKKALGGRDYTSLTTAEINEIAKGLDLDQDAVLKLTDYHRDLESSTRYGYGDFQAAHAAALGIVDRKSPATVRYRKGLDGVVQYLNSQEKNAAREAGERAYKQKLEETGNTKLAEEARAAASGKLVAGEILSVYLTGETGRYQNDEVIDYTANLLKKKDLKITDKEALSRIDKKRKEAEDRARKEGKSAAEIKEAGNRAAAEQENTERLSLVVKKATDKFQLQPLKEKDAAQELGNKDQAAAAKGSADSGSPELTSAINALAEALKDGKIQMTPEAAAAFATTLAAALGGKVKLVPAEEVPNTKGAKR